MNKSDRSGDVFAFGEEWLTGWQLIERLDAAQLVVQSLTVRLEAAHFVQTALTVDIGNQRGITKRLIVDMRDLARDLARVAGDTHREKNEAILAVIYRLLSAEMGRRDTLDMDEIPF